MYNGVSRSLHLRHLPDEVNLPDGILPHPVFRNQPRNSGRIPMVQGGGCQPSFAPRTPARAPRATRAYTRRAFPPETSGPATRPRRGLAPRRPGGWERLFLCERQRFAPSNRPGLLARPMRVQIVLGRACILRGSRTAGGPVPLRGAGLRGRRDRRCPATVARGGICIHVVVTTNAHRLCRVLLAFLFELSVWRCRRHRRV